MSLSKSNTNFLNPDQKKIEENPQSPSQDSRDKKYYKCTEPGCEMIFSKKCVLRDHQMAHKKQKPYKCQIKHVESNLLKEVI